jgi:RNA methyltransferase, TrmH family
VPDFLQSAHNPFLQDVRRAASKGALTGDGCALAEGFHLLDEALRSGVTVQAVIASTGAAEKVEERLHRSGARLVVVPEKLFEGLVTTETPQGVLTLVQWKEHSLSDLARAGAQTDTPDTRARATLLILDQIQDPGNAGAMLRTAEAFGATGAIFTRGGVRAFNPKAMRGSAGSIFRLPLVERVEPQALVEFLSANKITLHAAMPRAEAALAQVDLSGNCAIAIGSEAHGVCAALASAATALRIPTASVESLNAATAAAVILYEAQRQRSAT